MIEEIELNDESILTMSLELRKAVDMTVSDLKIDTLKTILIDLRQMAKKVQNEITFLENYEKELCGI